MKRGFTLIELMVSVTLFAIVMVIALGALLSVSAAERKAETIKSVTDNLNFALESMTRTIRTGTTYHCDTTNLSGTLLPQNCSSGATYLAFLSNDPTRPYTAYCLGANPSGGFTVYRLEASSAAALSTTCSTASGFEPITAYEITISNMKFYVTGACAQLAGSGCASGSSNDSLQPKVTMTLRGYINIGTTASSTFAIQTSATQRIYDQ